MDPFPHYYEVAARGEMQGHVRVTSAGAGGLETAAPAQFGGPGDHWSPETLLLAAVADCFVLSFRGVARAARLPWQELACHVEGTLERTGGVTRFTVLRVRPRLVLADGGSRERALECLDRTKRSCLIANSLQAEVILVPEVIAAPGPERSAAAGG
ncbi:MAG TPA: OsmC family protein [Gammaproteobacteria bacterium]|nr:OsmC family protein [Gammaproteobacteria bacterium]